MQVGAFVTYEIQVTNNGPDAAVDAQVTDLVPVGFAGGTPGVFAVHPSNPARNLRELIDWARSRGKVNFASQGIGSTGQLAMELLRSRLPFEVNHIPYKGGGPLMNDAIAGHVPLSIGSVFVTKPHIDSGRMRPLAVTTTKRAQDLPNVPTIAENGYPGFEAPAWWAVLASSKTPPEIIKRMNEELNKVLKNPEVAKKLDAQGIDITGGTPEQARSFIEKQMTVWAKVVKDNDIKAD